MGERGRRITNNVQGSIDGNRNMRLRLLVAVVVGVFGNTDVKSTFLLKNISGLPPFFLIPPLCGSRLSAWSTMECSGAQAIRPGDNVWVNPSLISTQPRCWQECVRLWGPDMEDSPSCRSRADDGLHAIGTLSEGLLGMFAPSMVKLIEALTELGYDNTRLHAVSYDFRLTPDLLEKRNGYFSKFKTLIEYERKRLNMRALVFAHSLGARIFAYFLQWLEVELGAETEAWIDENIAAYFCNGNPLLGSPDIATSLIVGDPHGMPISLKLIHEVLASAGGMLTLAPPGLVPFVPDKDALPWIQLDDTISTVLNTSHNKYGEDACIGPRSTLQLFRDLADATGDSHTSDLAAFVYRLCNDEYIGSAFDIGFKRPPIDDVHVAYGVGRKTRLSTTFGLDSQEKKISQMTRPYFARSISDDELNKVYDRPTRTFAVTDYISESGLDQRVITNKDKQLLATDHYGTRSGDDTIPYASLSASHAWLIENKAAQNNISVFSLPMRKKFRQDEVFLNGSYDPETRIVTWPSDTEEKLKACTNTSEKPREPRLTVYESSSYDPDTATAHRTSIWEMEEVGHQMSANNPIYLEHIQRMIHRYIMTHYGNNGPKHPEDLLYDDISEPFFVEHLQSEDFIPSDDSECHWSFSDAHCAYPTICEYRYIVGDLTLSQSCRLKH